MCIRPSRQAPEVGRACSENAQPYRSPPPTPQHLHPQAAIGLLRGLTSPDLWFSLGKKGTLLISPKFLPAPWSHYSIFRERSNLLFRPPGENQNQNTHHPQEPRRDPCIQRTCALCPAAQFSFPLTFGFHTSWYLLTSPLTQYGKRDKGNVEAIY